MKKAFSLSFFVIGLIALASIMITNSPSDRGRVSGPDSITDTHKTDTHKIDHEAQTEVPAKSMKGHTEKAAPPVASVRSEDDLSKTFLNAEVPLEDRLDAWVELNKKVPLPARSLIRIAVSPNPFEGKKIKAHTIDEKNYQREESFRIMALQSLERLALESKASISLIDNVAKNASSPIVRQIAKKMREFVKNGQSYTRLFEQSVLDGVEVPE